MPVAAARYRTANRRAHGLSLRLSPTAAADRDGKNKCRVEVLFGFLWVEWILVVFRRATKIQAAPSSSVFAELTAPLRPADSARLSFCSRPP